MRVKLAEAQPLPGDQPARLSGIHHSGAKIDLIVACSPLKAQCFLSRMAFFWEVSRCTTAPTILPCERMRPFLVPRASSTMPNRESMAATVIQVRETVTEGFHPPRLSGTHRLGAQADFTLGLVPWMIHPLLLRMRVSLRLRKRTAPATWFLSLYSKPRRPALMSIPNLRSSPIRVEHDLVVTAKAMLRNVAAVAPPFEALVRQDSGFQADFTLGLVPWIVHPWSVSSLTSSSVSSITAPAYRPLSSRSKPLLAP